jgi:DNA-binding transcriptional regulator YdaS (Cro superfamily)
MTEHDVLTRLRAVVEAAGGQRAFAEKHGFTPAYVNDVLHGRRALADRICAAIGVRRTVVYQDDSKPL